jgi:uncharacterized membrane protein (DUF485 family)
MDMKDGSADLAGSVRMGALLMSMMAIGFFCFILVGAYAPSILSIPIATGSKTSLGIIAGLALILASVMTTVFYVMRTNRAAIE